MLQLTSPRLPGVPLLHAQYTGPEYSRWRRSIKFALQAKGTWKYCSGECTMPMPSSSTTETTNLQPSLLDERREWVKHDREVKLDIFLSLSAEVMFELFEVGPPLPPSSMNAQEMLEALEGRFAVFNFEAYHHAFCHFLNLHIDQYPSIEEFNREFATTLEDLLDHGHPLSNVQACSAYFSKLRCTQNPWVAKKLEEWDAQTVEVDYRVLLKESPPWSIIRPLATKGSHNFPVESIPEEYLEDSSTSDSDSSMDKSDASTASSISVHSRNASTTIVDAPSKEVVEPERRPSIFTATSQEITIQASPEAIAEIESQALQTELSKLPTGAIPERGSSKNQIPSKILSDDPNAPLPEWLASKKSVARRPQPSTERPLPPLPPQAQQTNDGVAQTAASQSSPEPSLTKTISSPPTLATPLTALRLETTHPTLRPQTSTTALPVHPALRSEPPISTDKSIVRPEPLPTIDTTPLSFPFPDMANSERTSSPVTILEIPIPPPSSDLYSPSRRPSLSTPNLAIPWPCTPDILPRPHSSRAALPFTQAPNPMPSLAPWKGDAESIDVHIQPDSRVEGDDHEEEEPLTLPLQGTRDSAWDYLYQSKGGYLITSKSTHARTPSSTSSSPPQPFSTFIVKKPTSMHKKSASLDFVARLSGDSMLSSGEETEGEKKFRKKKSWMNGVNLARFSAGKGVREII